MNTKVKKLNKKIAVLLALALIVNIVGVHSPVSSAKSVKTKAYTVSKSSGTYSSGTTVKITVKKGYKVYYTTNGKFTTSKVIKSGKSKTITIKKNTNLKIIAVKSSAKVTKKKLNGSYGKSKVKTYKYKVKSSSDASEGTPDATETTDSKTIVLKSSYDSEVNASDGSYTISKDGVLTINKTGTYTVSSDGTVDAQIVNAATDGEVTLVLNGLSIKSSSHAGDDGLILGKKNSSPLNIVLAAGTVNTLTNDSVTETASDGDVDYPAGILVKKGSSLTIGGTGTLNIYSKYGNGIKVKLNDTENDISTSSVNDTNFWAYTLTIKDNPTITIECYEGDATSADPSQDAIHSKNSLLIEGGKINIKAADDGIHAEAYAKITGGEITVSKSTEALEGARVEVSGGTLNLTSSDDGINAANGDLTANASGEDTSIYWIKLTGGNITVNAEGDGIDSNGCAYIDGAAVTVYGPSQGGNGALDVADGSGVFEVNSGSLIATSSTSDMAIGTSGTLSSVVFTTTQAIQAGTTLTIEDASGNTVATVTPAKSTAWVLYAGSNITKNTQYTLKSGTETIGTATAGEYVAQTGPGGVPGQGGQGQGGPGQSTGLGGSDQGGPQGSGNPPSVPSSTAFNPAA